MQYTGSVYRGKLRARCFGGTVLEWEYTELAVIVFFWDLFWFRNERHSIPSILLPIAESDGIAGYRLTIFAAVFRRENCVPARFPRSHRLNFCHVSYSIFRIAQSLFFWELIFCLFCYSYTGIRIDGIVPKELICWIPIRQHVNIWLMPCLHETYLPEVRLTFL